MNPVLNTQINSYKDVSIFCSYFLIASYSLSFAGVKVKVKQSLYRPGQALGIPGG